VSISTTSSSSATASPTIGIKETVGAYIFQGCWTEATNIRALSGASYYDYNAMTLEECASDCAGWNYFGVEYGGACKSPPPPFFCTEQILTDRSKATVEHPPTQDPSTRLSQIAHSSVLATHMNIAGLGID
jgi:hypothetical protein